MANELPSAKERYNLFAQFLQETYGYEDVDPRVLQVAVTRYHDFQRSDTNKLTNEERKARNLEAREARSSSYAERRANAEAKRQEREAAKAAREEAKAARAVERAAREADKGAADASAPKRGRRSKKTAQDALAEAGVTDGDLVASSEGQKRSEGGEPVVQENASENEMAAAF